MDSVLQEMGERIAGLLDNEVLGTAFAHGELTVDVRADCIVKVLKTLRDDNSLRFKQLTDICGVDYPERTPRFDVVYHLVSFHENRRIRVRLKTDADTPVPSVVDVFSSACWYERECWDLYGVLFAGNPDLRRILTDYGFSGHPLRKDFPLTGFVEVRYSEEEKRVVYEPVSLIQDFRNFDFMSPWEGAKYILPGDEKADAGSAGGAKG